MVAGDEIPPGQFLSTVGSPDPASACNGFGCSVFSLSPRIGASRRVHLATGSKSDRRNFARCSRAGSDEFIDFGLRPSNGANADLDG